MGDKPRILIVGAGIAGLTLAAGLGRQRITPAIVEIADGLLTRGLGLFLTSNVFLALRRIGLDQTVIERGVVIEQQVQTDPSEKPTRYHDFRPFNARYAPNIGIAREGLMTGLLTGVGAQIRYSNTIISLDQSAGGVEVGFSDGTGAPTILSSEPMAPHPPCENSSFRRSNHHTGRSVRGEPRWTASSAARP
jgi:2-polyprenyl-6-methoxyphenol hydroxylase-like FAD-dependent oxidoreductase